MRAIDADAISYESIDSSDTGRHEYYYGTGIIAVRKEDIEAMPTIQPEIIRCKDCKHRDPVDKKCDCGHDIQWQLPRQDDWFCADGER